MLKRGVVLVVLTAILISAAAGCADSPQNPKTETAATANTTAVEETEIPEQNEETLTTEPDATSIDEKAQEVFNNNCISCHGVNLEGDSGPNLQEVGSRKNKEEIVTQITDGGSKMPAFKNRLEKEEIEAVAAWLSEQKK